MSEIKACKFSSNKQKTAALADFLRKYGDGLPENAIRKASVSSEHRKWVTKCDAQGIAAAVRYDHNDWYLCTLKNAAVRPDLRGKGLGSAIYKEAVKTAHKDPSCLVLAGDITSDNKASIAAAKSAGFKTVNRFCWANGEKPADILHFVKLTPTGDKC